MMKSSIKAPHIHRIAVALVLCLVMAGNGHAAMQPPQQPPHVLTTIPPLYALTREVMAGVTEPELLMKPGDTPHHYTMKPKDAQMILRADLVICTSREYEYYLTPLIDALPERKQTIVEALAAPGISLIGAQDDDEDAKHELGNAFVDMHFWLDPINAIAYTQYITEELSEIDPAHANNYATNAKKQIERLRALDEKIRTELHAKNKVARYASYHASLMYFQKRYGLQGGAAITRTPESGASVEEADALYKSIESGEIRCMFQEPEFPPRLLKQAQERFPDKVRLMTLDTLGSTFEHTPDMYEQMMLALTGTIQQCLFEK